jgi:hypothetical protein
LTAFRGSILEDRGLAVASSAQTTVLTRLAKLPSPAARVQLFVPWSRRTNAVTSGAPEALILEFKGREEVRFALALPLEFAKMLRRRNCDVGWAQKRPECDITTSRPRQHRAMFRTGS